MKSMGRGFSRIYTDNRSAFIRENPWLAVIAGWALLGVIYAGVCYALDYLLKPFDDERFAHALEMRLKAAS